MIDKYNKGKQNLEVDLTIYVCVSSTECRITHIVKNPLKMWWFKCWGNNTNKSKLQAQRN